MENKDEMEKWTEGLHKMLTNPDCSCEIGDEVCESCQKIIEEYKVENNK